MNCPHCLEFVDKEGKKAPKEIEMEILMKNPKFTIYTCPECGRDTVDFIENKMVSLKNVKKK